MLLSSSLLLLLASPVQAKERENHVGVGANLHMGSVPALSIRYRLPTGNPVLNIQAEALAGVMAQGDTPVDALAGGRVLYGVVAEDNMHVFLGAGAGLNVQAGEAGFRLQPVMGADFFFFGLENLGFTAEWGLNVDLGAPARFSTAATIGGGVHYWF